MKKRKDLSHLTDLQYKITQEGYTEKPFENEYDKHFEKGIYVDIVDGTALFISSDKFDSGCGWPVFSKPINDSVISEFKDLSHNMVRTEVKSTIANSHLGHVFNDGPKDKGGLRYCINSGSLRFIAFEDLDKEGYSEYKKLFKSKN